MSGDVNGDGQADLLAGTKSSATYSLYLADNDGSFSPAITVTLEVNAYNVALGDIDGDGHADAVVTNYTQSAVRVYPGLTSGGFGPARLLLSLIHPSALALADLNGDGRLDIVVTTYTDGKIRSFLQATDGSFTAGPLTATPLQTTQLVLKDVDGDGQLDAVLTHEGNAGVGRELVIDHGLGNGGFTPLGFYQINQVHFTLGDFNGDGILDVATWGGQIYYPFAFRLGLGGGAFGEETPYFDYLSITGAAAADWTGDGKEDVLICAAYPGAPAPAGGSVYLLPGTSSGLSSAYQIVPAASVSGAVLSQDFDGDGHVDFAAASSSGISVTDARPGGGFGSVYQVSLPGGPYGLALGDVNGDGRADIAVEVGAPPGTVYRVYRSFPDRTMQQSTEFSRTNTGAGMTLQDMNGDGRADLVALSQGPGTLSTYFAAPDGVLGAPDDLPLSGPSPRALAVGSLGSGTAYPDVVYAQPVYNGNPGFLGGLIAQGNGSYSGFVTYAPSSPNAMAFGKIDADDFADVLVIDQTGSLSVYHGTFTSRFAPIVPLGFSGNRVGVVLGDLDGDGHLDAVTWPSSGTALSFFHGVGDGTFLTPTNVPTASGISGVTLADVDLSGTLDIVVTHPAGPSVSVLYGHGDGSFEPEDEYFVDLGPGLPSVADVDGDGRPDIVVGTGLPMLDVLYQRTSAVAVFPAPSPHTPGIQLAAANPAREAMSFRISLPRAGTARLVILDLRGRVVRDLGDLERSEQQTLVTWNGRTARGERAPTGVYFARLTLAGSQASAKFVLMN